ncbi:ribonuclease 2B-like [Apodemus sylvaticus]|uniref:ribonuclease 2B-like n=1 Tax=Apodemus sylvaticus TaxID=10129 RepID=UPI002244CA10|nr:ribonuclease 2B-like [Apodemus sylvaticus]
MGLVLTLPSSQESTPSQTFDIQRLSIRVPTPRCDDAMQVINKIKENCKNLNTFLHTTFADVVRVCGNANTTCKDGISTNCHNISSKVNITICDLKKRKKSVCPKCRYIMIKSVKFYRVACNRRTP